MESSIQTLVFPLISRYSRQFFDCSYNGTNVRFLYDSGAKMPVWCTGSVKLMSAFPNAEKLDFLCKISGFGQNIEPAEVYIIPDFRMNTENGSYSVNRLHIASLEKPHIGCDFVISETMFSKIDSFSYRREKRELHLVCESKDYHCSARRMDKEILDISVWSQQE